MSFDKDFARCCPYIDDGVRDFMKELVQIVAEAVIDDFGVLDGCEAQLEIVSGMPSSGYMPLTDGGVEAVLPVLLTACHGEPSLPGIIDEYVIREEQEFLRQFCRDAKLPEGFDIYAEGNEEQRNKFYEYLEDLFENDDTCWFIKVRCWQSHGRVHFLTMLNVDFNYGRDSLVSAGMPDVEPNPLPYRTEKSWSLPELEGLDAGDVAKQLAPEVLSNLHSKGEGNEV